MSEKVIGYMFDKQIRSNIMTEDDYKCFFSFCNFLKFKKGYNKNDYLSRWLTTIASLTDSNTLKQFEKAYIDDATYPSGVCKQYSTINSTSKDDIRKLRDLIEAIYSRVIPPEFCKGKEISI